MRKSWDIGSKSVDTWLERYTNSRTVVTLGEVAESGAREGYTRALVVSVML